MLICRRLLVRQSFTCVFTATTRLFSSGALAKYHPAVVRAFNNQQMCTSNSDLLVLFKDTKHFLKIWDKHAHKSNMFRTFTSNSDQNKLRAVVNKAIETLKSASTDDELNALCSILTILSPNSEKIWLEFDRLLIDRIQSFGTPSIILASTTLLNASALLKFKETSFKLPRAVGRLLIAKKWNAVVSDSDSLEGDVERLGLAFQLLAHTMPHKAAPPSGAELDFLSAFVSSATTLIQSTNSEIPFSTWKYVWTYAPRIDLPDCKEFYRILYQRVMETVARSPLQLLYEEDAIVALFDSMIQTKLKHSELIHTISEELLYRGFNYQRVGLKLFSALLELGAVPLASSVLNNLMKVPHEQFMSDGSATSRLEVNLGMHSDIKSNSFKLTNTACDRVYHMLKESDTTAAKTRPQDASLSAFEATQLARQKTAPKQYRSADLILALLCFNRKERLSDHLNLLESIEVDFLTRETLLSLPLADVVSVLHVYAILGRNHNTMLKQLDQALQHQLTHFTDYHWSVIPWSCARLNHTPSYLDQLLADYFKSLERVRVLTHSGMHVLCKTLWAMAVLQRVEWRHIRQARPLLEQYVQKADQGWEMDPLACVQLAQVQTELNCRSSASNVSPEEVEMNEFLDSIVVKERVKRKLKSAAMPSYTHKEASRILNELGIGHEIEKMLHYGYIVDIFIPPSKSRARVNNDKSFLGTVIELDGPYHFDSYLKVRSTELYSMR